jgi:hypothetical protein
MALVLKSQARPEWYVLHLLRTWQHSYSTPRSSGVKSVDMQVTGGETTLMTLSVAEHSPRPVVRANNLPKAHKLRKPSYYIVLSVDGQEYKTTHCDGSVTPKWDEDFTM